MEALGTVGVVSAVGAKGWPVEDMTTLDGHAWGARAGNGLLDLLGLLGLLGAACYPEWSSAKAGVHIDGGVGCVGGAGGLVGGEVESREGPSEAGNKGWRGAASQPEQQSGSEFAVRVWRARSWAASG